MKTASLIEPSEPRKSTTGPRWVPLTVRFVIELLHLAGTFPSIMKIGPRERPFLASALKSCFWGEHGGWDQAADRVKNRVQTHQDATWRGQRGLGRVDYEDGLYAKWRDFKLTIRYIIKNCQQQLRLYTNRGFTQRDRNIRYKYILIIRTQYTLL